MLEKWDEYLDHLYLPMKEDDLDYKIRLESWTQKSDDLLADLLQLMGKSLGYDFDKVRIRKSIYVPRGHGEVDIEQRVIRRGLANIMAGRAGFPISEFRQAEKIVEK